MKMPRWVTNVKAGVSPAQVILLAVSFLLIAILVPIAMTTSGYLSTTTGWNAAVVTIFVTVVPILFIIGVAIKFIPSGKGGEYIQAPKRLLNSIKAEVSPAAIIIMAIGFLLLGILTPIAMTQIITACSTTWGTATFTIFTVLLPILFLVGVAIRFIPRGGK